MFRKKVDKRHMTKLQAKAVDQGGTLKARAYYTDKSGFIVSSMVSIGETGKPDVLDRDVDDAALGEIVHRHLMAYEWTGDFDTKTWAAYDASGFKTMRSFEEAAWHIDYEVKNQAIIICVSPRLSNKPTLSVRGLSNHKASDTGKITRDCLLRAMALREQKLI